MTSYLTGSDAAEPNGARAFKINGVPIVIRGGGFSPNLLLHYSSADIARQIALMKNMGLNTIRLEGHLMPADFYQQMDQAGILVNAGFQCCDAWELQSSGLTSPADYAIMQNSATAIAQNLRDHPSVFSFQWSDEPPLAQQESVTLAAFAQQDFDQPVISSAEYNSSPSSGYRGRRRARTTGSRRTTGTTPRTTTATTPPRPTRAGRGVTTASRAPATRSRRWTR